MQRKPLTIVAALLGGVAILALVSGLLTRKSRNVGKIPNNDLIRQCAHDGTKINPLYEVDAYLSDNSVRRFCAVCNAIRWLEHNRDKVLYFTVTDEVTGERFDSTLSHFVQSDVVNVPEVKNRIHVFFSKEDALKHAKQYNGKLIDNPFGQSFQLPAVTGMDSLTIGVRSVPDALPIRMAVFRPIFKENRLSVRIVEVASDEEGFEQLANGTIDGLLSDLPSCMMHAHGDPSIRVIKNMLRANPFRSLFALVASPNAHVNDISQLAGKRVALPKGASFRFYFEFYTKQAGLSLDRIAVQRVETVSGAWGKLVKGDVAAALLRSPYTDMAMKKTWHFLADDRSLPWMSALAVKQSVIEEKPEAIRKLVFALEQSVLALNLNPNKFVSLLREQGGIPPEARSYFTMPIFEGANAPSEDEMLPVSKWLVEAGMLKRRPPYEEVVDARFLPNPDDVGLAFCCK